MDILFIYPAESEGFLRNPKTLQGASLQGLFVNAHKQKRRNMRLFFFISRTFPNFLAESEGFEPPVRRNAYTTFRVWLFRPLRQLSFRFGQKRVQR